MYIPYFYADYYYYTVKENSVVRVFLAVLEYLEAAVFKRDVTIPA